MISTAIKSMLKDVDSAGTLIPVSSLNDNSDKLSLLSVIVKTKPKREWFWKKPKYQSRGFTLSDVLPEDSPLSPSSKKMDFVDHSGIFRDQKEIKAEGKVEGLFADIKFNVGVNCSYKQECSFGRLKKEEVEVKKLLNHLKDKRLDMTHPVIKQSFAKPRAVLCILTERIITTEPCLVTNKTLKSGNICAKEAILLDLSTFEKASVKQSVSKQSGSVVSLQFPENTVIAFSLIELRVKSNGTFDLCLFSDNGGFEQVKPNDEFLEDVFMGGIFDHNSLLDLNKELEKLSDHFQLLSVLPTEMRSNLLQLLRNTMKNREEVSVLESVLDQMCDGETPDLGDLRESVRKTVQAIVDLVDQIDDDDKELRSSLLSSIHLIVSAMDEMPDEGLSVLESCCSPPVLEALQILVQCVAAGSGETLSLTDAGLTILTEEEVYGKAQCLFDLSNVILKREEDTLKTEMKDQTGYISLLMSIAVKGLASLV
ncbi:gasdermin-E [Esox lucius]|uniref:Gasdermin Eb n=1 Tax=Esox lucius TaxID=8010 RepID=A0A3P8XAK9_ESOLU|nr:gasdermin-E [Esox lucius]XP_034144943.1 gasdermin-E [Esox lucius]